MKTLLILGALYATAASASEFCYLSAAQADDYDGL